MDSDLSNTKLFINGVKACLPTLFGYWAVAMACGAIGPVCGLSFWQIEALAMFLYAGSSQLVFCSLYATHASIFQLVLSVGLINLRYLFMAIYIARFFRNANTMEKIVNSALITDETFGVAAHFARQNNDNLPFFWLLGLNLTAWLNWIIANAAGALIGSLIPAWANEALSFSLVGMFIGLLVLTIQSSFTRACDYFVVIIAVASTIILHEHIDKHIGVIIITLFSAICGSIFYKHRKTDII